MHSNFQENENSGLFITKRNDQRGDLNIWDNSEDELVLNTFLKLNTF